MNKVSTFLSMIKIEHSLFALPFAFTGMILAADGLPPVGVIFWVTVAVVAARTFAMGFNRVADAEIDAKNPRTAERDIPAGRIGRSEAMIYIAGALVAYEFATWMLNPLCFALSWVPLVVFVLYSYTKRFTYLCHVVLGVALGLAPVGAWVAVTGTIDGGIVLLGAGVLMWVAGFDIIYAIQDMDFDRTEGLHSIPAKLGPAGSLMLARILHAAAFAVFVFGVVMFQLGFIYLAGVLLSGAFMVYEHRLVKPDDISKVGIAFFNLNAYISISIFVFTALDVFLGGGA